MHKHVIAWSNTTSCRSPFLVAQICCLSGSHKSSHCHRPSRVAWQDTSRFARWEETEVVTVSFAVLTSYLCWQPVSICCLGIWTANGFDILYIYNIIKILKRIVRESQVNGTVRDHLTEEVELHVFLFLFLLNLIHWQKAAKEAMCNHTWRFLVASTWWTHPKLSESKMCFQIGQTTLWIAFDPIFGFNPRVLSLLKIVQVTVYWSSTVDSIRKRPILAGECWRQVRTPHVWHCPMLAHAHLQLISPCHVSKTLSAKKHAIHVKGHNWTTQ